LEVGDDLGGAGATFREAAIICTELGRAAVGSDYLGSAVLGAAVLNAVQPGADRAELLSGLAAAQSRVAVALSDDSETVHPAPAFTLTGAPGGWRLAGRADFVPDAVAADRLLLVARDVAGTPIVVAVQPDTAGISITDRPVLDETRRFGAVVADGVEVPDMAVWQFRGDPAGQLAALADRACVAVACDSLGLSEAMLAATVDYVKVRNQFGRPIGSFQAVKHACADMAVRIAVADRLVTAAVDAVASGAPDCSRAASMAKAYTGEGAVEIAGKAMQLHGGIGYTWESGVHVYLKRATLNRALFGSPAAHRRRIAAAY
jgi:alkylation response protein AidB-like acyl-CoA dehydrogenase